MLTWLIAMGLVGLCSVGSLVVSVLLLEKVKKLNLGQPQRLRTALTSPSLKLGENPAILEKGLERRLGKIEKHMSAYAGVLEGQQRLIEAVVQLTNKENRRKRHD